jgi:phosphatidylinositol alpha-mannosyltransferase
VVKVGIVCPFSWSYIGGVGEHAECQAQALERLGVEARVLMGDDPPRSVSRLIHADAGRTDRRPDWVISLGTSVVVPANSSRPHIVLSPASVPRLRRALRRERFDVIHVHEPMTPAICVAALALARCPIVATWHATGDLGWMKIGMPMWGRLMERIDHRIAVSDLARLSAERWLPGQYEIIPNGITIPERAEADGRDDTVVFVGRNDPRKGLEVLLRAWPEVRRKTGARLKLIGAESGAIQRLMDRAGVDGDGIDILGVVVGDPLTEELVRAKVLAAPSLGGESFGMVLTRAFGCATPVVASDIPGYARVMTPQVGVSVPPGDAGALGSALVDLLRDEPRRRSLGLAARDHAIERYGWDGLARRLLAIYEGLHAAAA